METESWNHCWENNAIPDTVALVIEALAVTFVVDSSTEERSAVLVCLAIACLDVRDEASTRVSVSDLEFHTRREEPLASNLVADS